MCIAVGVCLECQGGCAHSYGCALSVKVGVRIAMGVR